MVAKRTSIRSERNIPAESRALHVTPSRLVLTVHETSPKRACSVPKGYSPYTKPGSNVYAQYREVLAANK
jgi:hypothetical protein